MTRDEPVNKPINPEAVYYIPLAGFGNYDDGYFSRQELDRYNQNPDLFAAKYFGCVSVEEYREWIRTDATPYCSELTKAGRLCKCTIGGSGQCLPPAEWRALHRMHPCKRHEAGL